MQVSSVRGVAKCKVKARPAECPEYEAAAFRSVSWVGQSSAAHVRGSGGVTVVHSCRQGLLGIGMSRPGVSRDGMFLPTRGLSKAQRMASAI